MPEHAVVGEDLVAVLTPILGDQFTDRGLDQYLFEFSEPVFLEQGRTYTYLADFNMQGEWPLQIAETQALPFTTTSGSFLVFGAGHGTADMSSGEHAPLVVEINPESTASIWIADSDGNWSTADNWRGGVPNRAGAHAVFGAPSTKRAW
jgi:hypothetical protein